MRRIILLLASISIVSACCGHQTNDHALCPTPIIRCPAEITYTVMYDDNSTTYRDTVDVSDNMNFVRVTTKANINYLTVSYNGVHSIVDIRNLFASPYPVKLISTKYLK